MQNSVNCWHSPLQYKYKDTGTFETRRSPPHGNEVWIAPPYPMDTNTYLFDELKKTLHNARIPFKIYPNGEVFLLAPFGVRYGALLGEVARVYWLTRKMDQATTINNFREGTT